VTPTRYYLDTEFIDDGKTVDLISIGVVCEDGREFYAEANVDWSKASGWVLENVKPHLTGTPEDRDVVAGHLRAFVGAGATRPKFWSWCSAYDWIAVCQLYGTMLDKPASWPNYCCDLQQELDRLGIDDDQLPAHPGTSHNALADAHWHRDIHEWLVKAEQSPAQVVR